MEMREEMALHLPLPCLLPSEIDLLPSEIDQQAKEKQARSHEGGEEYMEVWSSFLQMKIEEHKQREAR
jgi:hypothetical protein